MASRLNPYIAFRDNAREAMEFYQSVFGGELNVNTFGEYGDAGNPNGIMHAQLETPAGFTLMASDTHSSMTLEQGSSISVSVSGEDEAELRGYWDKLVDRGEVTMALEKQVWGDIFGMVKDQYGVSWMIDIVQPQES
jgi:PhnB protein